jgi:hypothetical protein
VPIIVAMESEHMESDHRNLARICEQQAALCEHRQTRDELLAMAREYRVLAEWQERQERQNAPCGGPKRHGPDSSN